MVGFFSLFKDNQNIVKKEEILFVHIPDDIVPDAIKEYCSKIALDFARKLDVDKIYLNYGKENFIEYDYSI